MFIDNKKPLENFDRIEFKKGEEVKDLLDWRDNNKELVRNFNFVLEKCVIDFTHLNVKIICEKNNNYVYLDMIMNKDNRLQHFHTIKYFYKTSVVETIHPEEKVLDEFHEENVQSMITVFCSLMAYMEHFKEDRDIVNKRTISSTRTKKNKNGKKKSSRRISRVVYNLNYIQSYNHDKREYNLDENKSWMVRGHWRNLKNGNKTWIKPYPKGNKDGTKEQATYKF